jgi:hypothetical protein
MHTIDFAVLCRPELRKKRVKKFTLSTVTMAKWSDRIGWPDELKEDRVKKLIRSLQLVGPELMKNVLKSR